MTQPRLSIIIVNYNVRYFLEQALRSVRRAVAGLEAEVFVIDNASSDGSCELVKTHFPEVILIENAQNVGFSTANNQAIRASRGEYVLLLNPDTLVEEDTFRKCLDFMDARPRAGGLGVKMIDGAGQFLPESKRGFPSPWVAFCKTFGLASLFSTSKIFNEYHLGYLSKDENHEIDVLAGAFMMLRKSALDEVGLLDEAFFMYGEDIDLSYRLQLGSWTNWYFADTQIIHYKGESTKKGSLNYVRVFYQAMIIFAKKHFSGGAASFYVAGLEAAIWMRAGLTLAQNFWQKIRLPLADAAVIFGGFFWIKKLWAEAYFNDPFHFEPSVMRFSAPFYLVFWLGGVFFSGGYDEKKSLRRLVRGLAWGTLGILAVYGLLDSELRSSRVLILMGAIWATAATVGLRFLFHFLRFKNFKLGGGSKNLAIVGSAEETTRARGLLTDAGVQKNFIGRISMEGEIEENGSKSLGKAADLAEIVRIFRIDELIFCSKDLPAHQIIGWMTALGDSVAHKILPEKSLSIIGSASKNEPGELYTIDFRFNLLSPLARRNKAIFDFLTAVLSLVFSPILVFSKKGRRLLAAFFDLLFQRKTVVGYAKTAEKGMNLPRVKASIISPLDGLGLKNPSPQTVERLHFLWAKDWSARRDLEILGRWFFEK